MSECFKINFKNLHAFRTLEKNFQGHILFLQLSVQKIT